MADIDALVARLEAAEAKLKEHDKVIAIVGCTDPKNMEADQKSREFFRGVIAVGQAAEFLGKIGRVVLLLSGLMVAGVAFLTHWKASP
jgi:hypothetical protein